MKNKSLEALERLSGASGYYRLYGSDYDIVKQDLEELIILKDKITELEKENQELKNIIEADIKDLDKYRNAIDILKDKVKITVKIPYVWIETHDNCVYFKVHQQQYDILKEVLE